jgi:hypothetical protein
MYKLSNTGVATSPVKHDSPFKLNTESLSHHWATGYAICIGYTTVAITVGSPPGLHPKR